MGGVILAEETPVRRGRLDVPAPYEEHGIYRYSNGVNPRAILALAAGALVAPAGWMVPAPRFLLDGAWFSATLVSFAVYYARMRPATAADARLTPALSENG